MSFTTQSASVPVVETCREAVSGPAMVRSSSKDSVLINDHIRTRGRETLIVHREGARVIGGHFHREGNRLGRIAFIFIESIPFGWRRVIQHAAGTEIKRSCDGLCRRPLVEAPP